MAARNDVHEQLDPDTRAHEHLAAYAANRCSAEDIAATLRVLDAMMRPDAVEELAARMTCDQWGMPRVDTAYRKLRHQTWVKADALALRLYGVRQALVWATGQGDETQ